MADFLPQLFDKVEHDSCDHLVADDAWAAQQKVDGVRIVAIVTDGKARFVGRNGAKVTFAAAAQHFRRLAGQIEAGVDATTNLIVEGELLVEGGHWHLFDLASAPAAGITPASTHAQRRAALEVLYQLAWAHQPDIHLVPEARGSQAKAALFAAVAAAGAEGVVFKRTAAPYRCGLRTTDVVKAKITHEVDIVVMARNTGGPDSKNAELGLWDGKKLVYMANCSMIGKPDAQVGDVIEVRYLTCPSRAAPGLREPTMMRVRPDKAPEECTFDQLSFASKAVIPG